MKDPKDELRPSSLLGALVDGFAGGLALLVVGLFALVWIAQHFEDLMLAVMLLSPVVLVLAAVCRKK